MRIRRWSVLNSALGWAPALGCATAAVPAASFLPSQAARGERVYDETCAACHQTSELIGPAFVESWNDRRAYDFYALVRGTMPLDNPGGLKEQEYVDAPGPDTASLRTHEIAVRYP